MHQIREARQADANRIAQVHVDTWITTYSGLIDDQFLSTLSVEDRSKMWTQVIQEIAQGSADQILFVAETSSGEICGFIVGGKNRSADPVFDSELFAIYVCQKQQGIGIGKDLVRNLVTWLLSIEKTNMVVWVLENNPFRKFYENLGGALLPHKKSVSLGDKSYSHVAYGWTDLKGLLLS